MKKVNVLIGCMFAFIFSQAQQITGAWSGNLDLHGKQISVIFHVTHQNQLLSATMDSPSQKIFGFSTTKTEFKDSVLTICMDNANMKYQGRFMKDGTMKGVFTQIGKNYSLNLTQNGKQPIATTNTNTKDRNYNYAYSYYTDTVSVNDKFKAVLSVPLKTGKTPALIIDCTISSDTDSNKMSSIRNLIDHFTSAGFTVFCSVDNKCDTNTAQAYLKTLKTVNQKKISVLTVTPNEMIAKFGDKSKTLLTTDTNNKLYQLTNWLLRVA